MRKPAAAASAAFHAVALLVLFSLRFHATDAIGPANFHFVSLSAPPRVRVAKEGGGGQREALPASRGRAPKPSPRKFFMAPAVAHNDTPRLILDAALTEAPHVDIQSAMLGNPLAPIGAPSGGMGGPVGIGDGGSGGVGDGDGAHQGGAMNGGPRLKLTRQPQVIYQEEPEYSEEARQARYEGTVVIAFDVDTSGRPVHLRVVRSLGLGLDEKALAAVARWKFRPAEADRKPVTAPAQVAVTFRLL